MAGSSSCRRANRLTGTTPRNEIRPDICGRRPYRRGGCGFGGVLSGCLRASRLRPGISRGLREWAALTQDNAGGQQGGSKQTEHDLAGSRFQLGDVDAGCRKPATDHRRDEARNSKRDERLRLSHACPIARPCLAIISAEPVLESFRSGFRELACRCAGLGLLFAMVSGKVRQARAFGGRGRGAGPGGRAIRRVVDHRWSADRGLSLGGAGRCLAGKSTLAAGAARPIT